MVAMIDVDLTTGKGLTIAIFALAVMLLMIISGGFTVILGATIVGGILFVAYYVGLNVHRKLSGKNRGGRQ